MKYELSDTLCSYDLFSTFLSIFRFRYSLTENKRALIKFMYSVNWDEESEVNITNVS